METVQVQLPSHTIAPYSVRVGAGQLGEIGPTLRTDLDARTCVIITDSNVAPLYLARTAASLEGVDIRVLAAQFAAGEAAKNLRTVGELYDNLLPRRLDRNAVIIALGGGVAGDLAGFIAATLLRGLPFVQAPTTLLAAVDASVGGKVGIDHAAGKNLIGAFHQPRLVITDLATFKTLPRREIACGLAECVKHAFIRDGALLSFIETRLDSLISCDPVTMEKLVAWNVQIKAEIVEMDPYEKNQRAWLNFGHTFGHALETVGQYHALQHGEAVALGMVAAARLSEKRLGLNSAITARLIALLDRIGLPTRLPGLDAGAIFNAMKTDKKNRDGALRLVLLADIARPEIISDVPAEQVFQAIESLNVTETATGH